MPDIHTDRLVLRTLRSEDAGWIARDIVNPDVQRWLTSPPHPYELHHAEEFVAENSNSADYRTIVCDGEPIGVISIDSELGYWLAQRAWGNGYVTEAAYGMLHHRFSHGGGPVLSGWLVGNDRSEAVLRKLGFVDAYHEFQYANFLGQKVRTERVTLSDISRLIAPQQISGAVEAHLPYLKTNRLKTRPLVTADLDEFRKFAGQEQVAKMTGSVPSPFSLDEAEKWLELRGWNNPPGFMIAVTLTDGTLIGSIGCGPAPTYDIGYLISPEASGNGYASEICTALVDAMFMDEEGPTSLNACVFTDNPASARVLDKCGFEYIADCLGSSRARLEPATNWQYRLSREDWKGQQR